MRVLNGRATSYWLGVLATALFSLALGVTSPARADDVTASARATHGVIVRETPSTSASPIGALPPGARLEWVADAAHWRTVRLADGRLGYVSAAWTTVIATVAPPPTTEVETTTPTAPGPFVIHVVDVGTGLAVIVQGPDFILVYDGGSNDDLARGPNNRLLAYFRSVLPNVREINAVVLSHPHRDHVELLPDLFDAYQVDEVWDAGRNYPICGYRMFLQAIIAEPHVVYHDAVASGGRLASPFSAQRCYGQDLPDTVLQIPQGEQISDRPITLGHNARMTILHADATPYPDPNENSLVTRVDLGNVRLLLMGDAPGGGRADPASPPAAGSIEGDLLACCADALHANILVLGHHGSKTSSRSAFLRAVNAQVFIVSSGPKRYGTVTLPDTVVLNELPQDALWRTDLDDRSCTTNAAKIGPDDDSHAGGCDNIQIHIDRDGEITTAYFRGHD